MPTTAGWAYMNKTLYHTEPITTPTYGHGSLQHSNRLKVTIICVRRSDRSPAPWPQRCALPPGWESLPALSASHESSWSGQCADNIKHLLKNISHSAQCGSFRFFFKRETFEYWTEVAYKDPDIQAWHKYNAWISGNISKHPTWWSCNLLHLWITFNCLIKRKYWNARLDWQKLHLCVNQLSQHEIQHICIYSTLTASLISVWMKGQPRQITCINKGWK